MSYIEFHILYCLQNYNIFPTDLWESALKKYFIIVNFEVRMIIATFAHRFATNRRIATDMGVKPGSVTQRIN